VSEATGKSALPVEVVKERPAETGALASAIAVLIAYVIGLDDPAILAALTIVVGAIPGLITWIVTMRRGK
jgi:uncharacterized YccA/Bax inhibitor family protein